MSSISPTAKNPERRAHRRLTGSTVNVLWIGFLAGIYVGFSMAPSVMTWFARLVLVGLTVSVLVTFARAMHSRRAERRNTLRQIAELERRMERLIPRRRVFTHGHHPKQPPNYDEAEHDWLPVARRGRKNRIRQ